MRANYFRVIGTRPVSLALLTAQLLLLAGGSDASQGQPAQETARRQFESGRSFQRDGRHAEALKDFESIVQSFPTSDVADDALASIAELQLDTFRNPAAARTTLEQLSTKYGSGTAAPMALVLLGRVQLAEAATPAAVDAALASFDRVRRMFPESDAVPAASYYAGEALRGTRRFADALLRYNRVLAEAPRSVWAARSRLGAARCLVQQGRPREAMAELQRTRLRFPDSPEAGRALAWSTILYKLYVRPPTQAPFVFTGRPLTGGAARIRDVRALAVDSANRIYVVGNDAVRVLSFAGSEVRAYSASDARSVFFDRAGAAHVLLKGGILRPDGTVAALTAPKPDGAPRPLDGLEAVASLTSGVVLVADRNTGTVVRLDARFANLGPFSNSRPARMATGPQDEVAMLDGDTKAVSVSGQEGNVLFRIAERGTSYRFENPVDVAVDALGFVYVLDRDLGAVLVFDPSGKFVLTFTLPENAPGAFRRASALALDGAGRLVIADDRAPGILVFQ